MTADDFEHTYNIKLGLEEHEDPLMLEMALAMFLNVDRKQIDVTETH